MQPGLARDEAETYLDESMISADEPIGVFGQQLQIVGCDQFTVDF